MPNVLPTPTTPVATPSTSNEAILFPGGQYDPTTRKVTLVKGQYDASSVLNGFRIAWLQDMLQAERDGTITEGGKRLLAELRGNAALKNDVKADAKPKPPSRSWMPQMALVALLLIAILPWPYGYYTFLRLVCCPCFIIVGLRALDRKSEAVGYISFAFALLYNPLIPVRLGDREIWAVVNVVTAIFAFASVFLIPPPPAPPASNDGKAQAYTQSSHSPSRGASGGCP